MDTKSYYTKGSDIAIKVVGVIWGLTAIGGAYAYYLNNIWKPKLEVLKVDFDKAEAEVKIKNKTIYVYGDATFSLTKVGAWGVRFGSSKLNNKYDRLELVKNGMVVKYIKRNEA